MEDNTFNGNILYLIELDQGENAIVQQVDKSAYKSYNLMQNDPNLLEDSSTIYLKIEPSVTEAHLVKSTNHNEDTDATQIKHITEKRSSPNILRCNKNKKCKTIDTTTVGKSIFVKNEILKTKTPKTLEMTFINDTALINFKDEKGHQMFTTQQLTLPDPDSRPVKLQLVTNVCAVPVSTGVDFTLPHILTNLGGKMYLCPLHCNKAFLHIADAKLHTLKHAQIKPFKCNVPECPWEFYTQGKLARHKETHLKTRNFICDTKNCNRAFSTIYNLNEHRKKHRQPATLPCLVVNCTALFQNDKQRREHYKTHDPSEAPFHCHNGKCTRSFFIKAVLDTHLRSCLQRESQIVCKYPNCGKEFPSPYRLREHIRQHTGAKPYRCTWENCTLSFATASKLRRHQSVHTGDRKFHCTIGDCTKSFLRSEHLKDHTLTHIEKKAPETEAGKLSTTVNRKQVMESKLECAKIVPEDDVSSHSHNADILLEQAIQSLGVPSDIILGSGLLPEEPLTLLGNENFSTVNLRDLD